MTSTQGPGGASGAAPVQFPVILKYANKSGLKRNISTAERKKDIEKHFGVEVPRKPDILNMLVDMDKKMDVFPAPILAG